MLKVAEKRMNVVRSRLQTVNYTLVDIATNELQIRENSRTMQKQTNKNMEKTNQAFSQTALFIATNKHMIIVEQLIGLLKEHVIYKYFCTERNIITPIITPGDIIRDFQDSHPIVPRELSLPTSARVAYEHVLIKIIDIDVFLMTMFCGKS
jgi:hypothetical protein